MRVYKVKLVTKKYVILNARRNLETKFFFNNNHYFVFFIIEIKKN